jgi:hypothetical protein
MYILEVCVYNIPNCYIGVQVCVHAIRIYIFNACICNCNPNINCYSHSSTHWYKCVREYRRCTFTAALLFILLLLIYNNNNLLYNITIIILLLHFILLFTIIFFYGLTMKLVTSSIHTIRLVHDVSL